MQKMTILRHKQIFVIVALFLCGALAFSAPAFSQSQQERKLQELEKELELINDLKDGMADCTTTKDRIERLTCYDKIAGRLGFITPDKAEREEELLEKIGFWEITKRRTAAGESVMYLKNDAAEEIISKSGISRRPTFVIKCKHGQTDVYLDWKSRVVPEYAAAIKKMAVTYQLDASEPVLAYWELSTDAQALFVPTPVDFIRSARSHYKLILNLSPPHDSAQTVVHDISGLDKVLPVLVKECYN